jgi:hypothetical protein
MVGVVGRLVAERTGAPDMVQADRRGFEEESERAADDVGLQQGTMCPCAVAWPHVRHEHPQHAVTFPEQRVDCPLQTVAHVRRPRIIVQGASVAMVYYDQRAIGPFGDEVIGQA